MLLLELFQLTGGQLWGIFQADCMVGQVRDVSVVLVPAFQEANHGVEEEQEDQEEDDNFLWTDSEG